MHPVQQKMDREKQEPSWSISFEIHDDRMGLIILPNQSSSLYLV